MKSYKTTSEIVGGLSLYVKKINEKQLEARLRGEEIELPKSYGKALGLVLDAEMANMQDILNRQSI